MNTPRKANYWLGALVALMVGAAPVMAQQTGSVAGLVRSETGEPIPGAQVSIVGTNLGTLTQENGRYLIRQVPEGDYQVRVELIGFGTATRPIAVLAGQTITANVTLNSEAIALEEIVVTGVSGPTAKMNLPIEVSVVDSASLSVTSSSAGGMLAGKVAGARVLGNTGLPGSAPSIMLRGPTSINGNGRGQEPLFIVDGVILGSSLADINSEDIESIEVVKGAAAASLYGSRAANGVVQIRTKRGRGIAEGAPRYTFRTEYGMNSLEKEIDLANNHLFSMTADQSAFSNSTEAGCESFNYLNTECALEAPSNLSRAYQINPWPGTHYNNMDRFFDPGSLWQSYLSAAGRSGNTNYHISFTNNQQEGVLYNQDGYKRNAFRMNLDQGFDTPLQLSANVYYSRSEQDDVSEGSGSVLYNLMLAVPIVDLARMNDETGQVAHKLEPRSNEDNPIYELTYRDQMNERQRFVGGGNLRWEAADWMDFEANLSFDRLDYHRNNFYPNPYYTNQASSLNQGFLGKRNDVTEAWNASATATFNKSFGALANRTQFRYLMEDQDYNRFDAEGRQFVVKNTPNLNVVTAGTEGVSSLHETIRSEGYFAITNFNYDGRYIIDALIRRDGSSLFGPEERWQTYYRGALAWRVSNEPFFNVPAIDQLKLRYSYGTAGGRPRFDAQYETYSVTGGQIRGVTLGNENLAPELAKEHEAGVDMQFLDRFDASVTYAKSNVEDQILPVPLPAPSGFQAQWRNAGTLESTTWEASLGAQLMQKADLNWSARVLFDRTRQEITELSVPAYRYGVNQQGIDNVFYARQGESVGTFYGTAFAHSCSDLNIDQATCTAEFKTNDEGYLVWVGAGNSATSGPGADNQVATDDDLWLTSTTIGERSFNWGIPVKVLNEDGIDFSKLGSTVPDFNVSLSSNLDWRGFSFYGLLDSSMGFDVYNLTRQWAYRDFRAKVQDQTGLAAGDMKPATYHQTLYNVASVSEEFVEDGSFVKLRELSARYTIGQDGLFGFQIPGANRVTLGLVGRNLVTWTDYSGFDPETGFSGGESGSAVINRFDAYRYPNFRTVTAMIELGF